MAWDQMLLALYSLAALVTVFVMPCGLVAGAGGVGFWVTWAVSSAVWFGLEIWDRVRPRKAG